MHVCCESVFAVDYVCCLLANAVCAAPELASECVMFLFILGRQLRPAIFSRGARRAVWRRAGTSDSATVLQGPHSALHANSRHERPDVEVSELEHHTEHLYQSEHHAGCRDTELS